MITAHKNPTQANAILNHLMDGKDLTALDSLQLFGCMRLAARIYQLRKEGHEIEEEIVTHNGKRFARYYIPTFTLQYA